MKRPQGPEGTDDFLEALLEITNSDIELVRVICVKLMLLQCMYECLVCVHSGKSPGSTLCKEVLFQTRLFDEDWSESASPYVLQYCMECVSDVGVYVSLYWSACVCGFMYGN